MDGERFDRLGQALGNRSKTPRPLGALLGFALAGSHAVPLAAQDDIATAGSGGYATASSSGGACAAPAWRGPLPWQRSRAAQMPPERPPRGEAP